MRNNRKAQRRVNFLRKTANTLGMSTKQYRIHRGAIVLPISFGAMIDAACREVMPIGPQIKISTQGGLNASLVGDLPSGRVEVWLPSLPSEDDPEYPRYWERATDAYLKTIRSGPSRGYPMQDRVGPDKASSIA